MRFGFTISLLVPVVLVLAGGCACGGARSLRAPDGRERHYLLHVPERLAKPAPLVIALHGGGGNAENAAKDFALASLADAAGFIVVYPEGTGRRVLGRFYGTWNADEQCCGDAREQQIDDVGFISRLIDVLVAEQGVDPARVYATGISNGGSMAHRLGCELSEKIAAIAPVASPRLIGTCNPSRPVAVMILHGTQDPCAPYEDTARCGGCFAAALAEHGMGSVGEEDSFTDCKGAASQGAIWQAKNQCAAPSRTSLERGAARCETFDVGCAPAEVSVCTLADGGHTVPGSSYGCNPDQPLCQTFMSTVGPINEDLSMRDVWDFFARHSR